MLAKFLAHPRIATWLVKRAAKDPGQHIMSPDGTQVYMYRYWLFNKVENKKAKYPWLPSMRIHHIMVPDADRHLHDHPWNARTFILKNWYFEERIVQRDPLTDPDYWHDSDVIVNFHRSEGTSAKLRYGEYHRITTVPADGVWTLFVMGRFRGHWGFLVNDRKIPRWRYEQRTNDKGLLAAGFTDGKNCPIEYRSDQQVCVECGMVWDANDICPPACPPNNIIAAVKD